MKRRYTLAQQIIDDIDKCYAKAQVLAKHAEQLDLEADALFKDPGWGEHAKAKRLEASRVRLRANNLINKKAKNLGAKLSEFLTGTMTIIPDNSVQA